MNGILLAAARSTLTTTPIPTSTPMPGGQQAPHSASFDPTSGVAILVYFLAVAIAFVILTPVVLRLIDKDFFKTQFITWWLLHYTIAAVGVIAVVLLGVTGTINAEVISALLGSLFGYVLGSAASRASGVSQAVETPVSITTTSPLPSGSVGAGYSQTIKATGGKEPYGWSVPVGALPAGLHLDPVTGAVTGTPTTAGSSAFTVHVGDSAQRTLAKVLCIEIE
jgi:Putative Ig domain